MSITALVDKSSLSEKDVGGVLSIQGAMLHRSCRWRHPRIEKAIRLLGLQPTSAYRALLCQLMQQREQTHAPGDNYPRATVGPPSSVEMVTRKLLCIRVCVLGHVWLRVGPLALMDITRRALARLKARLLSADLLILDNANPWAMQPILVAGRPSSFACMDDCAHASDVP